MKRVFKICFFAAFSLLFSCAWAAPDKKELMLKKPEVKDQRMAPDFELQDTRQDIVRLSSYRNKQPVLLFFWTSLCPLCEEELRIVNNSYAALAADGVEVLSINAGERPSRVQAFVRSYHLSYHVLMDMDTSVAISYRVFGVPTYVLVDKKGGIVFQDNYFPREEYKGLIAKDRESAK